MRCGLLKFVLKHISAFSQEETGVSTNPGISTAGPLQSASATVPKLGILIEVDIVTLPPKTGRA